LLQDSICDIIKVELRNPPVFGMPINRASSLLENTSSGSTKNDLADLFKHISIEKRNRFEADQDSSKEF